MVKRFETESSRASRSIPASRLRSGIVSGWRVGVAVAVAIWSAISGCPDSSNNDRSSSGRSGKQSGKSNINPICRVWAARNARDLSLLNCSLTQSSTTGVSPQSKNWRSSSARCGLAAAILKVTPRPWRSQTSMKPFLTIGFGRPSTMSYHHSGWPNGYSNAI
jgi:hypothetical protein